jgi:ligand-binding sensor domain-containing protein
MKILLCILPVLTLISATFSQDVSDWKILTSMKTVNDVAVSSDGVWSATTGGIFFNSFQDSSYKTFTRSEGLSGISFTAIGIDKYGKIWAGSSTGTIDVYNPSDGSVKTILDIYNSDMTSKNINEIRPVGDSIFISTDFGLSLIEATKYTFLDTYFKFGSLTSNLKVNSALKTSLVYACTDSGVAIQKAGATNLSAPESWTSYSKSDGLTSYIVHKVISFGDQVLAATGNGISVFNGTAWQPFVNEITADVVDLIYDGTKLYILTAKKVYSYDQGVLSVVYDSPYTLVKFAISAQSDLYAAGNNGLVKIKSDGTSGIILPNGPYANLFFGTDIDNDGAFWVATGKDGAGVGFFKYYDGLWTNYNSANTPQMTSNDFFSVYCADDNTTYIGNWGNGFVRVVDDSITVFTAANSGMTGMPDATSFLVVSGFGKDSKGNLWVLNYYPGDKKPLSLLTTDSTWYHFNTTSETQIYDQHYHLVIDQYDTKWYCIQDADKSGLYYFNENKTNQTTSDDKAGYLSTSNSLNSNTVTSIVMDRRGEIWVGTPSGVNIVSNTSTITSTPAFKISTVYALRQQSVNCIAVDPLNQKWVGTNQGLLLVNSDGSSLLASYTSDNSPLLTNIIKSVAIDENSGVVYVGTDMGLIKFQTFGLMPQDSFTDLIIYPSPFLLKSSENTLTIDGLIRDTDIKILSVSGKLINEFTSPGGYRATWNGTDLDGNLVNSGIYFIIAFDKEGNNVTTGKIAILR